MRELVILFVHALATLARLWGPGGIRSVVAESVLVKQQLLILNRSRQRSPNLRCASPKSIWALSPVTASLNTRLALRFQSAWPAVVDFHDGSAFFDLPLLVGQLLPL